MTDRQICEDGLRALRVGRTDDAVRHFDSVRWPVDDAGLWAALAIAAIRQGRHADADAALQHYFHRQFSAGAWSDELADYLLNQQLPFAAARVRGEILAARRVTVYTPAYACRDTLKRCLRSIFTQTYPIHEVVVVDDQSPDDSVALARRLGAKVFTHDANRGLAASCNTALRHAQGEFFVKIDSDLELHPAWLEHAMAAFEGEQVVGVGGRLVEHRTATIPDRWRRAFMPQHWGPDRLDDAPGLFGADCVFRTSALREVEGWDARYRTNFEDMDLSLRLKARGGQLVYEPRAWARHLRRDDLVSVLRTFWSWYSPPLRDRGAYASLAHAASAISQNHAVVNQRVNACVQNGWGELLYPTFLLYFWLCLRDVQYVHRLGNASADAAQQTARGVYRLVRGQLHAAYQLPARVAERALSDLRTCLPDASDGETDLLPAADAAYVQAFQQEPYLNGLSPAYGLLLDASLRAVIEDEDEHGPVQQNRPLTILFNPPGLDSTARWLYPSRREPLARRIREGGGRVLFLDAAARQLDEHNAHERVIGAEPATVVYSAAEGGWDRIAASARRLRLLTPKGIRLVLVDAGPHHSGLFDEVQTAAVEPR